MEEFLTLTSPILGERLHAADLVLLPCASIEQHGPHLPVATDTMIGRGLLERVDVTLRQAADGLSVVILPVIRFGCSQEHQSFPGTLSLRRETFENVVKDLVASVSRHGAKRVMLVNSHGGNTSLEAVVRDIRWETGTIIYLYNIWQSKALHDPTMGIDWHAGKAETSLLLAMHPELVIKDAAPAFDIEESRWLDNQLSAHVPWKTEEISPSGVIGDARAASAAHGQNLIAHFVEEFIDFITEIILHERERERQ